MKEGRKYEIQWIDCRSHDEWIEEGELNNLIEKKTKKPFSYIGYFVRESKGFYIFTSGYTEDTKKMDAIFNMAMFPVGCITHKKQIN